MLRWTFFEMHCLNVKISIKTMQVQVTLEKLEMGGGEGIEGLEIFSIVAW